MLASSWQKMLSNLNQLSMTMTVLHYYQVWRVVNIVNSEMHRNVTCQLGAGTYLCLGLFVCDNFQMMS